MNRYHATQHANFTDESAGRAGRAEKHSPRLPPHPKNPRRNSRTPLRLMRISMRVLLDDLDVDGRMILKWILKKQNGGCGLD